VTTTTEQRAAAIFARTVRDRQRAEARDAEQRAQIAAGNDEARRLHEETGVPFAGSTRMDGQCWPDGRWLEDVVADALTILEQIVDQAGRQVAAGTPREELLWLRRGGQIGAGEIARCREIDVTLVTDDQWHHAEELSATVEELCGPYEREPWW
jgi:hypothetical protein